MSIGRVNSYERQGLGANAHTMAPSVLRVTSEFIVTIIEEVKKLRAWEISATLAWFLVTIAPGFLILYRFQAGLVKELDTVKVLIFSAALTLPVVAVNALLLAVIGPFTGGLKGANRNEIFFWLTVWAFFVLYGSLLVAYFAGLSFRQFLGVVGGLDVVAAIVVFYVMRFFSKQDS